MSPEPSIAVVVMGYHDADTVHRAVTSVVDQLAPTDELVVVTSGGDDTARRVAEVAPDVPVIDHPEQLRPGGARNLGVAATAADVVAFLAADCWAEPGWIAGRRAAHALGTPVVASAMAVPDSLVGRSSYLCKFAHRLPTRRPGRLDWPDAGAHGASYTRAALRRLGGFDEDLAGGEDSVANGLLAEAGCTLHFAADVVTGHDEPRSVADLLRDQHRRGRRLEQSTGTLGEGRRRRAVARVWWRTFWPIARAVWAHGGRCRPRLLVALPLVAAGVGAQVTGRFRVLREDQPRAAVAT